jgi:hypothetical protein
MLDFVATKPHYWDHMRPVYEELERRGMPDMRTFLEENKPIPSGPGRVAVAAGYIDLRAAIQSGRRVIFMEHGAGQQYIPEIGRKPHTSYAGGKGREGVIMFLCPGPHVREANEKAYPTRMSVEIGVPKLDEWHSGRARESSPRPVVCISFHWNCKVSQESRSAFEFFRGALEELRDCGEFDLIAHAHPRARVEMEKIYKGLSITFVADFDDVLEMADVYVCDNSSTIYEFASTGRPVVLMNSPTYRREVEHGLRFWREAVVGIQCNDAEDLYATILRAITDPPEQRRARLASVNRVYSYIDGRAAKRAADAIQEAIMAEQKAGKSVKLRANRTLSGQYGLVGKGWQIEIFEDMINVANPQGVHIRTETLASPRRGPALRHFVNELTMDRGRQTMFTVMGDGMESDEAPEVKKAPPSRENKMAPKPAENKAEPEAVDVPKPAPTKIEAKEDSEDGGLSELDQDILARVRAGEGKTAIITTIRKSSEYTDKDVREAFEALVENKVILTEGPEHRPTYQVAE